MYVLDVVCCTRRSAVHTCNFLSNSLAHNWNTRRISKLKPRPFRRSCWNVNLSNRYTFRWNPVVCTANVNIIWALLVMKYELEMFWWRAQVKALGITMSLSCGKPMTMPTLVLHNKVDGNVFALETRQDCSCINISNEIHLNLDIINFVQLLLDIKCKIL